MGVPLQQLLRLRASACVLCLLYGVRRHAPHRERISITLALCAAAARRCIKTDMAGMSQSARPASPCLQVEQQRK